MHGSKSKEYLKQHLSSIFSWVFSSDMNEDDMDALTQLLILCDDNALVLSQCQSAFKESIDGIVALGEVYFRYSSTLGEKVLMNYESHISIVLRGIGHFSPAVRKVFSQSFRILVPLAVVYRMNCCEDSDVCNVLVPFDVQDRKDGIDVSSEVMQRLSKYANVSFSSGGSNHLRCYQQEGITWLLHLWRSGLSGVLADDMGLGKTLQTLMCVGIRVLEIQSSCKRNSPSLVVCPASLVIHWKKEINKFFSESLLQPLCLAETLCDGTLVITTSFFNVYIYVSDALLSGLSNKTVVICSYAYLRRHVSVISAIVWECVVLDEAHIIRNPHSEIAKCCFQLKGHARVALTGTPLQNKVQIAI